MEGIVLKQRQGALGVLGPHDDEGVMGADVGAGGDELALLSQLAVEGAVGRAHLRHLLVLVRDVVVLDGEDRAHGTQPRPAWGW